MGQEGLGKGEVSGRDNRIFRKEAEVEEKGLGVEGRVPSQQAPHTQPTSLPCIQTRQRVHNLRDFLRQGHEFLNSSRRNA